MLDGVEALPERARLLHVGLVKTGTTALQSAASSRRPLLLRHGVRYPGHRYNHRQAAFALLRRRSSQRRAHADEWDRLLGEVAAEPTRRILISNEFIADWDEGIARRFVEDLGPWTHVVFTVRSFASSLPSVWQQYVKTGYRSDFEQFLSVVLADHVHSRDLPPNFERHDQGGVVRRWADIVGPENVTVIVVDKAEPTRISASFEGMLGLPAGTLLATEQGGFAANRSLSAEEASLLLAVNRLLEPCRISHEDVIRVLRQGAIARLLEECPPAVPENHLTLPPWAAEAAAVRGRGYADVIRQAQVRVIGDLDELGRAPRSSTGRWTMPESVSTAVAAQALVGALSGGVSRGSNFGLAARARPRSLGSSMAKVVSRVRRQLSRSLVS